MKKSASGVKMIYPLSIVNPRKVNLCSDVIDEQIKQSREISQRVSEISSNKAQADMQNKIRPVLAQNCVHDSIMFVIMFALKSHRGITQPDMEYFCQRNLAAPVLVYVILTAESD